MKSVFTGNANRLVLLAFLALALYACFALIEPFLQPILLAMLIGLLAMPAHQRVLHGVGGRESIAALASCFILSLLIFIPMVLLLGAVLRQGIGYTIQVREWATLDNINAVLAQPWATEVQTWLKRALPESALQPDNIRSEALALAGDLGRGFAGVSTAMLGSITRFAVNFVLLLFVLFFVLRDYDKLVAFIRQALPLSRSQEDALFDEVREVSKSALLGSLLTAATQGFIGGIGLWLAGFPPLFWGFVMAFASLIPVVGCALIWVPAAVYLAVTGETGWAIFLALWGAIVVGSVDNFLRPLFMQGATMNTVVVFFALIGGLQAFGLIGLVYGPLVFAIALVFFKLYRKEFAAFLQAQDER